MAFSSTFATRLSEIRERRGLSQEELGERAGGIDKRVISRYETGKTTPSIESACALADALEVSLDHLTGLNYSLFVDDAELRQLLQGYDELGADDRATIKKILKAFSVYSSIEDAQKQFVR